MSTVSQRDVGSRREPTSPKDPPGEAGEQGPVRRVRRILLLVGERYSLVGLLIAVCLVFSFLPSTHSTFPTVLNLRQVLSNQSALVILAIAEVFPLLLGSFDLSIGAVCTVSAVAAAASMSRFGLPLALAVLVGIAAGAIVGAFNGFAVARLKLNAIVVTLGMSVLLTGIVTWYTKGNDITTGISQTVTNFGSLLWLGIPRVLYLVAVVIVVTWYLLGQTPFGRYIHAVGSNARAAQLVGINVPRSVFTCFLISGALAGVAGVLTVAIDGGAIVSEGAGLLFPALTAVFLSATVITVGRYNIIGTVIGVVFVAASVSGLTLTGAASWVNDVFNGAALIVAVGVSTALNQRRKASKATT